ncbi:hypothetical protein [Streptomyces sp. NPDC087862]|uniref:hypothetical protein n=1 Tax=Streptomyces sp. NPDC087862 TaxID=3365813 RepID=UPI003806F0AC
MRRLIAYVHVAGAVYGPGDDVPPDLAKRIGAHAWVDDGDQAPALSGAPPRSGRGSGVDAWRAFAEQHDVEFAADASREDIIAACEAAELVEREE